MQKTLKIGTYLLIIFVIVNLFLNLYGNNWGLPSRWHSDEKVTNVLHMIHERSIVDSRGAFFQPTGYNIILALWLVPYFIFLKLINFPLDLLAKAASVSWFYMAQKFPLIGISIYIYARSLSAIFGSLGVIALFFLAREVYNKKAALFSAAFLSVCMGYVTVNHFAKYPALLNLLIILVLLFTVKAAKENLAVKIKRYFYIAVFIAGITTSVKFSAVLLLAALGLAFYYSLKRTRFISAPNVFISFVLKSAMLFVLGFLILTPSFLINCADYLRRTGTLLSVSREHLPLPSAIYNFCIANINFFLELITLLGVPIFVITLLGIISKMINIRSIKKEEIIIFSFAIVYWFSMVYASNNIYPQSKYIIAVVPLIVLFAGKFISEIFSWTRVHLCLKICLFLSIFIFSFLYTCMADLVLLKNDTRYAATRWIRQNVIPGSKIETFNQLHLVCADDIVNDYEITYLGRSSRQIQNDTLPRWIEIDDRQEYIDKLIKTDSSADYIIVNVNFKEKLYSGNYLGYLPGVAEYLQDLFELRRRFVLAKTFSANNRKIVFNKFGNIISSENIFWDPVPDYESVSPTIYIFKKIK